MSTFEAAFDCIAPERRPAPKPPLGFKLSDDTCRATLERASGGVAALGVRRLSLEDAEVGTEALRLEVGSEWTAHITAGSLEVGIGPCRVESACEGTATLVFLDRSPEHDRQRTRFLLSMVRAGQARPALSPPAQLLDARHNPDEIRSLFTALFGDRARGHIRTQHGDEPDSWAVQFNPDFRLLVEWQPGRPGPLPPFDIIANGRYSDYRFHVGQADIEASRLIRPPKVMERIARRKEPRAPAPPAVRVTFRHPTWPDHVVERPLRDVSFTGISFTTQPEEDLLCPGMRIEQAEVTWKNGPRIKFSGLIRHVSPGMQTSAARCGMSLVPADVQAAQIWTREVDQLLHPRTQIGPASPELIWNLYAESGYFELGADSSTKYESLKQDFKRASLKLAAAPHLGCQVASLSNHRAEASLMLVKGWTHAWILYQFARHQDANPLWQSGNRVLCDILLHGYEHSQLDPELRWQIAYVRKDARFSRIALYDFAARHAGGGEAATYPFRAMEGSTQDCPPPPRPAGAQVGEATDAECEAMLAEIARTHPRAYVEAYDLVPGARFRLERLRAAWSGANLQRERAALVARIDGQAVAGAILDLTEAGLYLVGLSDSVRVVEIGPGGRACFGALLHAARAWYRQRGKDTFVLFEEQGDPSYALEAGLVDIGAADHAFWSRSLVPEFLEHIFALTAPKPPLFD